MERAVRRSPSSGYWWWSISCSTLHVPGDLHHQGRYFGGKRALFRSKRALFKPKSRLRLFNSQLLTCALVVYRICRQTVSFLLKTLKLMVAFWKLYQEAPFFDPRPELRHAESHWKTDAKKHLICHCWATYVKCKFCQRFPGFWRLSGATWI